MRWGFTTREVFVIFGITGLLAEITQNPYSILMGFWIVVYGFMVLLPAQIFLKPDKTPVRKWWHYPGAVVLMLMAAVICSLLLHAVFPGHPDNHFR